MAVADTRPTWLNGARARRPARLALAGAALVLCAVVAPARAQSRFDPAKAAQQMKARTQVALMERALEMAVDQGAKMVQQQLPGVAAQMLLFSGPPRARGHRLEGYGVFFDVEVPAISQSVIWSFQTLERDLALSQAMQSLRQHVQSVTDSRRAALEQALQRIEIQMSPALPYPPVTPPPAEAQPVANRSIAAATVDAAPATVRAVPPRLSPDAVYEAEVKTALIDAMLDHSGSIALAPDEWLTVAARDSAGRLSPDDLLDYVTIQLRIRGRDLAAYRADQLSRDEARKRVEIREF